MKNQELPGLLAEIRRSQNYEDTVGVQKRIVAVSVRKPHKQHFIRVHPDPAYRVTGSFLEDAETQELYWVDPILLPRIQDELTKRELFLGINRQGDVFLWPVKLNRDPDRPNRYNSSAMALALLAMTKWIRVVSNRQVGAYEAFECNGKISEPVWPETPFEEIFQLAFEGQVIREFDHPVLRKLRGEI